MDNRRLVEWVILAAVVFVLLPLFAVAALMASHFVFGMTGMTGIFGSMGVMHATGLVWAALAVIIVGALIGLLMQDVKHA